MSSEVRVAGGQKHVLSMSGVRGGGGRAALATLTLRERDVLELMADGLPNAEIAGRLFISVATVRSHVHSVIEKLGVHSRMQAVVGAYELSPKGALEAGRRGIS